jgi:signal peptidase II
MPSLTLPSASNVPVKSSAIDGAGTTSVPRNRYFIFASIAALGCAADLITKQLVFAWRGSPHVLERQSIWWLWEPFIGIETAVNTGALFGVGGGWGRFFALLSIAAAIAIPVWLFYFRAATSAWLTVALSCVMAGILGNLYDRLGLWVEPGMPAEWSSGVRDWILFRWRQFTWPNFNIADSLLVTGAVMLLWQAFRESPPAAKSAANAISPKTSS